MFQPIGIRFARILASALALLLTHSAAEQARAYDLMFWTDSNSGTVQRAHLDGTHRATVAGGYAAPYGIAVDAVNEMIYWGVQGRVMRAGLDGSAPQQLFTTSNYALGVEIDTAQNRVYAFDYGAGRFAYGPMTGGATTYLGWTAGTAYDVVASPGTNWIYFTEYGNNVIRRFDRTDPTTSSSVVVSTGSGPYGIAIDSSAGKLYWANYSSGSISRSNLDGSGTMNLLAGLSTPTGVALDLTGGYVYFGERGSGTIRRMPLAGGASQAMVQSVGASPQDLKIAAGLPLKWTAAGSGNWGGANWSDGFSPSASENLFITPTNGLVVTGSASAASVKSLNVGTQTSGVAELQLSKNLTAANGIVVQTRGQITMSNAVLDAGSGLTIDGAGVVTGTGVILGIIGGSSGEAGVAANGTLALLGGLTVGSRNALVVSQGAASLDGVSMAGGTVRAPNGITIASLSGYGTVSGAVAGAANSTITASGGNLTIGDGASPTGFTTSGSIAAAGNTVTLQSAVPAQLGTSTTLEGGTLAAPNGVQLDGANTISGYGMVRGPISGSNAASGLVATDTYSGTGTVSVGADQVTILTKGLPTLGNQITLAGGSLKSTAGLAIRAGQTLSGFGTVASKISGSTDSLIQASGGQLTLGDASRLDGFATDGNLEAGNNTVVLNSKGFANLGSLTTIGGGGIQAAGGVSLGVGRNLSGYGGVSGKVAAGFGATILATGDLALGDGSSLSGFTSDGELYTGTNTVTLNDRNQAVLGSLTQVGDGGNSGTLVATNGLLVDFGRNLVGEGTVNNTNSLAKAAIINGAVEGTGTGLTLTGYVKGVGTYAGNVIFGGTYSPGLSPASVSLENMNLLSTSTLLVELAGTSPGSQYDVINLSGVGNLSGTLDVELLGGFIPQLGNSFDIINGATFGTFGALSLPSLSGGLSWNTSGLYSSGVISVVPEPGTFSLLGVLGMCLGGYVWRKRRRVA
jgi:hypothetical protein